MITRTYLTVTQNKEIRTPPLLFLRPDFFGLGLDFLDLCQYVFRVRANPLRLRQPPSCPSHLVKHPQAKRYIPRGWRSALIIAEQMEYIVPDPGDHFDETEVEPKRGVITRVGHVLRRTG